ncbi:hypothetical protein OPT61_g9178 [Boeremia exigua]|uniref:Uncharacterized protein n=1 Tax=Boeremia exigua TaxID=749465 RepID=A0ACC2HVR3_9PLEO|nr:hypothetical protein OPT61_g9178 [Boeremia exigua]
MVVDFDLLGTLHGLKGAKRSESSKIATAGWASRSLPLKSHCNKAATKRRATPVSPKTVFPADASPRKPPTATTPIFVESHDAIQYCKDTAITCARSRKLCHHLLELPKLLSVEKRQIRPDPVAPSHYVHWPFRVQAASALSNQGQVKRIPLNGPAESIDVKQLLGARLLNPFPERAIEDLHRLSILAHRRPFAFIAAFTPKYVSFREYISPDPNIKTNLCENAVFVGYDDDGLPVWAELAQGREPRTFLRDTHYQPVVLWWKVNEKRNKEGLGLVDVMPVKTIEEVVDWARKLQPLSMRKRYKRILCDLVELLQNN